MLLDDAVMLFVGLGVPASTIMILSWLRLQQRLRLLDVVRAAAEAQHPMTAEAIQALSGSFVSHPRERDRRRGVMLASFGVALAVLGFLAFLGLFSAHVGGDVAVGVILAGIGAIPGCVGAGYIILSKGEREDGDD